MRSFSLKRLWLTLAVLLSIAVPAHAAPTEFDNKAAVIFTYLAIGDDAQPFASLQTAQFTAQIDELVKGPYKVMPLSDIVAAFKAGKILPDRTIAITFDGADRSILDTALPLLVEHNLPFTIFVPADRVSQNKPPYMNWDDLRRLKKTGLATFGLHPASYGRLADDVPEEIKRQINNSLTAIRKELDVSPTLIAYPFGEYDLEYKKIVQSLGMTAAFGQQSGVAYAGDDLFALPRFVLTERYGDIERFRMTANALPFPAKDISPADPHLNTLTPAIGFTVSSELSGSLKNLSCFSSTDEKPVADVLNKIRVELRMKEPLHEVRPRINCTLPVTQGVGEEPRWRWLGMLYTVPSTLLEQEEKSTKKEAASQHASDEIFAE